MPRHGRPISRNRSKTLNPIFRQILSTLPPRASISPPSKLAAASPDRRHRGDHTGDLRTTGLVGRPSRGRRPARGVDRSPRAGPAWIDFDDGTPLEAGAGRGPEPRVSPRGPAARPAMGGIDHRFALLDGRGPGRGRVGSGRGLCGGDGRRLLGRPGRRVGAAAGVRRRFERGLGLGPGRARGDSVVCGRGARHRGADRSRRGRGRRDANRAWRRPRSWPGGWASRMPRAGRATGRSRRAGCCCSGRPCRRPAWLR